MSISQYSTNLGEFVYQTCVEFPVSALTIPRQRQLQPNTQPPSTPDMANGKDEKIPVVSDRIYELCNSTESVSAMLAKDPTMAPGDAWKKLYGHHVGKDSGSHSAGGPGERRTVEEALEKAAKCGKWGPTQPSELFLRIYNDALCTLEEGVDRAMVSPPLMGSCGVLPLTIISVIPDIARHMSNIIVRAEREVILATNYWQNSVASKFLTDAMKELSRRAGQSGTKVVMKIIYDRGSPRQVFEPHYFVNEKTYTGTAVGIPHPDEIPNIDLQVMNYHQPMLGTFHAKYMVVDRKIGILQSNNIQDNDNLEMMIHLEGPIVDSLYDMALISWHKAFDPPLPSHNAPAAQGGLGIFGTSHYSLFTPDGTLRGFSSVVGPDMVSASQAYGHKQGEVREPGVVDPSAQQQSGDLHRADTLTGPTTTESVIHPHPDAHPGAPDIPRAVSESGRDGRLQGGVANTQAEQYLHHGEQMIPQAQIQEPSSNTRPLPEHSTEDAHYDDDIAGEVARVQTSVSPSPGESRMEAVTRHLNHTTNKGFKGAAPECGPGEEMTPYIPHPVDEPFPIALVCRAPYGPPNHSAVSNPQNAAWLSALRHAQKSVFIQTPTLNAEPLIPAIIEACERGVDVYCYVCLGYNDAGELLPMQGGHNEMVAHNLHKALSDAGRAHLHYYWYVAKDQTEPLVQQRKERSCHIKLMVVDERVGIAGNGNQDTQSWFHSQEINAMLDSPAACRAWADALRRNQNTHLYGALGAGDGVWRRPEAEGGGEAEGAMGVDPGRFSWAKGLVGAVKRVQGTGGF